MCSRRARSGVSVRVAIPNQAGLPRRSTGGSGGTLEGNYFSPREARDSAAVVEYLGTQPWSSGKIGTLGTSYVGGTQHALACARAPGLTCMIPVDSLSNTGLAGIRHGGAFELRFMNWIFTIGAPNARAALAEAVERLAGAVPAAAAV